MRVYAFLLSVVIVGGILGALSLLALGVAALLHLDYMKALVYTWLSVEGLIALYPRVLSGFKNAERVHTYRQAIDALRRSTPYGPENNRIPTS